MLSISSRNLKGFNSIFYQTFQVPRLNKEKANVEIHFKNEFVFRQSKNGIKDAKNVTFLDV